MKLFGKTRSAAPAGDENAPILVLGSGCVNCRRLEENVRAALAKLGDDRAVGHVTDFAKIAGYGVMATPGLVVEGKVLVSGRVPGPEELEQLLRATGEARA